MNCNYDKEERFDSDTLRALGEHYEAILKLLGEDPAREGLLKTPERVAKAMCFLTKGYDEDPREILLSAKFKEEYRQMVIVKDIELYSLCEHHMLPFYGKAHVAYIPNGYITGLSKIARVVEAYARRLQVQERLTVQIRDCIQKALNPLGVAVVIEASHMCMQMRGMSCGGWIERAHTIKISSVSVLPCRNLDSAGGRSRWAWNEGNTGCRLDAKPARTGRTGRISRVRGECLVDRMFGGSTGR